MKQKVACCAEFEEHSQKTDQDGFRIISSYWLLPYEFRLNLLCYQKDGQESARIRINFCPWCGSDLMSTRVQPEDSK
jgi:hypothetical protein